MLEIEHVKRKLEDIVKSENNLQSSLLSMKRKSNLSSEELVFVSTSIIASYWWCPVKAFILSKVNELNYFKMYLHDTITYSYELGYVNNVPKNIEEILNIGCNLTLNDMEKILKKRMKLNKGRTISWFENGCKITIIEDKFAIIQYGNVRLGYINPLLTQPLKRMFKDRVRKLNAIVVDFNTLPSKVRGKILEVMVKEKYPTIRWYFKWGKYVVIAEPDGLTNELVYEFKTTKNMRTYSEIFKVAEAQADIYGYFFRRKRKKIQTYVLSENKLLTVSKDVNKDYAEETLTSFLKLDKYRKFPKPEKWKCRICELRNKCPVV